MRIVCKNPEARTSAFTVLVSLLLVAGCGGASDAELVVDVESAIASESGTQAVVMVSLSAKPSGDVVVPVSSSDTTEGTLGITSLTFTRDNWSSPQRVAITGVDDTEVDGDQSFSLELGPTSADVARFRGLATSVPITNEDDESPGFVVSAISGSTTEAGAMAYFSVRLLSAPAADVVLTLASTDPTEGSVGPTTLTFTPENWSAAQTVTVTGLDDAIEDGPQAYAIEFAGVASTDASYANATLPADVVVSNVDDETAGISVIASSGLTTSESGSATALSVVLDSPPTATVELTVTSTVPTEGIVMPATLLFTPENWNAPQQVTIIGQDDAVADGNATYAIVFGAPTSDDASYAALAAPASITLTNIDNDVPGIAVSAAPTLITTESGGVATFTVALLSEPTANVTISYASSALDEGSVGPAMLVFTPENWSALQQVTVTGENDDAADGAQGYTIDFASPVSADSRYAALAPSVSVNATNMDNDSPGLVVATSGLTTTESGGTTSFTVTLASQPSADVTVHYASTATDEGVVSPNSLVFTTQNWNTPQTVTVTGQDDVLADGGQPYFITFQPCGSSDSGYANLASPPAIALTNTDDDAPGFIIAASAPLMTTEAGGTAAFTIRLTTPPLANVTFGVASSAVDEGTVSPSSLQFTAANWNMPRTVTVTGVNDSLVDGNQPYFVTFTAPASSDPGYSILAAPASLSVMNADDDTAGIDVALGLSATTSESGHTATFSLVLRSQPTANVTVSFASTAPAEGVVAPSSFTFTTANWNVPQVATVTGQNDAVADGNQLYGILFQAPASSDAAYATLAAPAAFSLTNIDNDVAAPTIGAPVSIELTSTSQTTVSYGGYLNGESFQQDAIVTFNGYQYTAYWSAAARVILARRPTGTGTWSAIELDPEYTGTSGDAHNTISLGVSPNDGRLHIAFDHHGNDLNYNFSVVGLLTNPAGIPWQTSSFQPAPTDTLGTTFVNLVTYPRFVTTPSGDLLLSYRYGASGSGNEVLWEYANGTWTQIGTYINGISSSVNAYLHGLEYSGTRLHAAWCWRSTPSPQTNQDLLYMYSDDGGRTWLNNGGTLVATSGSSPATMSSNNRVWTIPQNRGLINQEHMTVDNAGRVHVLLSHMPDALADDANFDSSRDKSEFFHYWRDTNGLWRRNAMGATVIDNFRGKIAVSSSNNLYAILPNLRIASASASTNWTNWTVIDSSLAGQYFSDPLIDRSLLRLENTLTVFAPTTSSGGAVAIDTISYSIP